MAVIKQSAVPQIVPTLPTIVKVLMIRSVEFVEAIQDVLGRVAVDDIQKHNEAHAMSGVNKLFQVFRWPISAARGEEVVDLIAEACVVGMFHDSHELDHIV